MNISPRSRGFLDLLTTISMLAASGAMLTVLLRHPPVDPVGAVDPQGSAGPAPVEISLQGTKQLGASSAPVALVVFSEFECPFCQRFNSAVVPHLRRDYVDTGKLLLVFKHFPLAQHQAARLAAEATECAGAQGRFWEMHDSAFEMPRRLDRLTFLARANLLGLDVPDFERCLGSDSATIDANVSAGKALGVTGTPTVFIGLNAGKALVSSTRIVGARTVTVYTEAIDELLLNRKE